VVDAVFRFLFKYPLLVFQQGDFVLGVSRPMLLALIGAAAVAAAVLVTYRAISSEGSSRDKQVLVVLRLALIAALLFCLVRPTLILKAAVPQQNFLGVLIDDSRSMLIADRDGQPRSQYVQREFGGIDASLLKALQQRFVLRFFRFSSSAGRLASTAELKYDGTSTRLGDALERARDELSGLPLAGLVMVTDGADTSDASLDESLASLKARSIPVFTLGVGQEHFTRDIQISRVETPRTVLKGSALVVDVVVSQTGYSGRTVPLNVEDQGRIVTTEQITLPADGESLTARVRFNANEAGARLFRFRVPPQDGEEVTQNNVRDALLEVRDRRDKVLYYEGEPRAEAKFVHQAVENDKNLQVAMLIRTAENKYYRREISSPDELATGFPKTREELFAYRGLILGSVEAAAFTPEQLRMIADFVNKRGGGLLMLGGRRSFGEGGWAGTPVSEVLPVVIDQGQGNGRPSAAYLSTLLVHPTRAGTISPVTQIADTEANSTNRWNDMPEVSAVNAIRAVKPGATTLLDATDKTRQDQIVLAYQRYGRGKALAMPIQDSWLWRMDAKMAVEDTTHATFWRRLVRWLVDGVPDPVEVTTTQDRVEPGEAVKFSAEVADSSFTAVNDSHVVATVTSPSGKKTEIPMEWTVSRDGEYRASFVPDEPGAYAIDVAANRSSGDQKALGTGSIHVRASAGDAEYFDANMRASLLRRIAEETGGRFFTPANAATLPEAVSYTGRGVTVVEERDLWDMPALLLLMLALMGTEWAYRRVRGLA
jgi:uncharacterized membrane protein